MRGVTDPPINPTDTLNQGMGGLEGIGRIRGIRVDGSVLALSH